MLQTVLIVLCCICAADKEEKPKKPEKPPTPKEIREAQIKAIKDKMAPIEKKLGLKKQIVTAIKAAPVDGKGVNVRHVGNGKDRIPLFQNFSSIEQKKKTLDQYQQEVDELTDALKPLQEELDKLKKTPLPKPEPKENPEAPEKKP